MSDSIFSGIGSIERMLDFHLQRHNVLASNLTNAETPGFQPRDLVFSDSLDTAVRMARTENGHMQSDASLEFTVVDADNGPTSVGGRSSIERATTQLTANELRYETGLEMVRRKLALLRYAATDGTGGT